MIVESLKSSSNESEGKDLADSRVFRCIERSTRVVEEWESLLQSFQNSDSGANGHIGQTA